MSPLRQTALAGAAFVLAFAIGLGAYFPGAAVSRYVSLQAERASGFPVRLSPLSLGLTGLSAASLELRPPESAALRVDDLRVPWTWRWVTEFPVSGRIGAEGRVEVNWSWSGALSLQATGIDLQDLPLQGLLPRDAKLQGRFDASLTAGPLTLRPAALRELPPGRIEARGEGIDASNVKVAGFALPPVHLDSVEVRAGLGRTVQVESATLRGDAQGTVSGTIIPNLARPADSRLSLNLSLQVQRAWLDKLGDLRQAAEAFLPGGRIEGALEGTLSAPVLNRAGKRP
jgi:type II secretion system protein N